MKKIKILLLTKIFPPKFGGIPNYYWNLVTSISKIDVEILTSSMEDAEYHDKLLETKSVRIMRINYFPDKYGIQLSFKWFICLLRLISKMRKQILFSQIDYIIVGQPEFFQVLASYIASKLTSTPYIICLHNEEIPTLNFKSNLILKFIFKNARARFCNSRFTSEKLKKFIGLDLKPVIITPGVEKRFFSKSDSSNIRKTLAVENKTIIYTISRLDERKGHDMVIKSLPSVLQKFKNVIYLIGGAGIQEKYLRTLVAEKKLNDVVKFVGVITADKLVEYHLAGDIFIMPNRQLKGGDTEGFGIVFLEANAVGNPVIGGRSGGAVDAIVEGKTGLLVDSENVKDISDKIIWFLENKEKAREMGRNGKERCLKHFLWSTIAKKFEDSLYNL